MNLDWTPFANFAGWIIPLIPLVAAAIAFAAYRKQYPSRRLNYSVVSKPVVAKSRVSNELEVSLRGTVIEDPHLTTVTIQSAGRADIGAKFFDDKKPIIFRATPRGGLVLDEEVPAVNSIEIEAGPEEDFGSNVFYINPQLMKKGTRGTISFVGSGPASISVRNSLEDVLVAETAASIGTGRLGTRKLVFWGAILAAVVIPCIFVLAVLLSNAGSKSDSFDMFVTAVDGVSYVDGSARVVHVTGPDHEITFLSRNSEPLDRTNWILVHALDQDAWYPFKYSKVSETQSIQLGERDGEGTFQIAVFSVGQEENRALKSAYEAQVPLNDPPTEPEPLTVLTIVRTS